MSSLGWTFLIFLDFLNSLYNCSRVFKVELLEFLRVLTGVMGLIDLGGIGTGSGSGIRGFLAALERLEADFGLGGWDFAGVGLVREARRVSLFQSKGV